MSESLEKDKQHAFDCFCKKVLRNEARDIYDEFRRQKNREIPFSQLTPSEIGGLAVTDDYFVAENVFDVCGRDIVVTDSMIIEALQQLPERQRNIVLLSYFLKLSDREIGEVLNMLRATVQYQRKEALRQLKELMEEDGYGK